MSRVRRKILSFSRFQQLVHEDPLMLLEFIEDENSEKLVDEVIMTLESGGEPKAACGSDSSARMGCIEAEHYSRDPRRPTCTVKMMPGQIRESNPYNSLQSSHSCLRIVPMLAEVRN
ncbi:unnamed protein product [Protopolystoma xenopodis]|uniref:Uncharacterized protein n=1 Tax=Protopolystoma xenopodis TaxID=117903 RepID=A0A3S5BD33_9PLAT|nr:unnamed protein product [Protopolystoma xenopodis]